jgi:hypothetical protein
LHNISLSFLPPQICKNAKNQKQKASHVIVAVAVAVVAVANET